MTSALTALIVGIGILILASFLYSLPVMLLWDAVMPQQFGLPEITWFRAWCLTLLIGLLFTRPTSSKD